MPNLDRKFWGGYYKLRSGEDKFLGGTIYHSYPCGSFTLEGESYNMYFFLLSKLDLPDTKGEVQESFDSFPTYADSILPLTFLLTGETSTYSPYVQALIEEDTVEGLDRWDILDKRMGVMVDEFMGFTWDEVLLRYPDILVEIEEGTTQNIKRCSLEE